MNINEMAVSHRSEASALMVIGAQPVPRHPPFSERRGFACMHLNLLHEIYSGPEGTVYCNDLNVLQGKAYEKPC